ncbi:MAG: hypothetical protein H7255_00895 [Ramlibacter sp.]|nr:hypothetical protein [Ramlibacter sp.]
MEHRLHEPKTETVGTSKKRTAFDAIENPEPGWQTRSVVQVVSTGSPPCWEIVLMHDATGSTVTHEADSLYVAWARATEQAHMMNIGLA